MPKVSKRVRFYEVRNELGQQIAEITDLEHHFYNVVASLPTAAKEHWQSESGLRVRGDIYRPTAGTKPRVPLIIIDKVHREPPFRYVKGGSYTDHKFSDPDQEFAEPKYLAFFESNVVATFTGGLRINVAEAALNTWRAVQGLQPITFYPVTDLDRLAQLASAGLVGKLDVTLPADVARVIYKDRKTPIGAFMRSRAAKDGMVSIGLTIDVTDPGASEELREELQFLVEDEETYQAVASSESSAVHATFRPTEGGQVRSQSFLGQELAMTISVDIQEPELGPQPYVASEALQQAFTRKQDAIMRVVGQG